MDALDRHDGQTDNDVFFADLIDESQRRRQAAIVVDVVGALRPCVSLSVCPFIS